MSAEVESQTSKQFPSDPVDATLALLSKHGLKRVDGITRVTMKQANGVCFDEILFIVEECR